MPSLRRVIFGSILLVLLLFLLEPESALACAMCQTVLPRGDEPLARGLFWSVLILLTAPFAVSAGIGGWLYYHYRKSRSASRTANTSLPSFSWTP